MNVRLIGSGFFCALLVFMLGASPTFVAREDAGPKLTVTVLDNKDQPAANCLVTVKARFKPAVGVNQPGGQPGAIQRSIIGVEEPTRLQKGGAVIARMKADGKGIAEFKSIKPGDYVLECGTTQKTGFKRESITLEVGKDLAISVKLN